MRNPFSVLFGLALIALAASSEASSVSDEVGVGSTQPSSRNPTTGFLSDRLSGTIDVSEEVDLRFTLGLTHVNPSAPANGAKFGISAANILTSAVGVDWMLGEHWDFGAEGDFSPMSLQYSDSPVSFQGSNGNPVQADGLVAANTGSFGGILDAAYNTAGGSRYETDVNVSVGASRLDTTQEIRRLETAQGSVISHPALVAACANPNNKQLQATCRALGPALRGEAAELSSLRVAATVTETLLRDTDVAVGGAYYLYDRDPTQVGYFSSLVTGRTGSLTTSLGAGIPIAPLIYSVRPEIGHRFGGLGLNLWYQFGRYVGDQGFGHQVGAKVQYRFSSTVKAWVSGSWQDDIQPAASSVPASSTFSTAFAAGVRVRF